MRKILNLLVWVLVTSCTNSSPLEEETVIKLEVSYKVNDDAFTDYGAEIYIYYGYDYGLFQDYNYVGNGQLENERERIEPDQKFVIESEKTLYIEPRYRDRTIHLLVEGKYYDNSFFTHAYSSCEYDIDIKIFFADTSLED